MAEAVGLYGNYAAPAQQGPYAGLGIEAWRRYSSEYLIEERFGRRDRYSDWRGRIAQLDQLYRGDWPVVFPDQSSITEKPLVQNLIKSVLDDIPMLVAEQTPSLRCNPEGDEDSDLERALIRQAIGNGYWENDHGDLVVQLLAQHLIGASACFLLSYTDGTSQYPKHRVLDPRGCLPNWVDWTLYDLMLVEKIMLRQAARLWPDLNLDKDPKRTESMEVVHLYAPDAMVKGIYFINKDGHSPASGKGYIVDIKPNPIGRCQVAWARWPTFDGYLRSPLDQLSGILLAQHESTRMLKDGLKKAIYPGKIEYDVENPEDEGPEALLHARSPESYMKPIDPAKVDPSVPMLLQQFEQHARNSASYASAREGISSSSNPASAAFLEGSQGKLVSFTKNVQRHLGSLRQQQTEIDYALDEKLLNFRKDLILPVANKRTYKPTDDIKSNYRCRMTYGIGSGLSAMNAGVMVKQDLGAMLISLRTAREQTPYILDPEGEELQRDREEMKQLMKQQLLQPQNAGIAAQVMALMARGIDFVKAIETVQADMQAQAQAMQAQQGPQAGQPQLPGGQPPEQAAGASLAMQKGGMPPQGAGGPAETEAIQPAFAPPPRALISVGRGRAA